MNELVTLKYVINSVLFSAIGIAVFFGGFILIDILTPKVQVWKEVVEKQNTAVAILLGAAVIGIAQIIASAIHG
jgi:putative membrane protein